MAVEYDVDGLKLLTKMGFDPAPLKAAGIAVAVTPSAVRFHKGNFVLATAPMKMSTAIEVADGKAPASIATTAKTQLAKAIEIALEKAATPETAGSVLHGAPTPAAKPKGWKAPVGGQAATKPVQAPPPVPAPVFAAPAGAFPIDQMDSGSRVKLRDATALYQPVFGTDGGSRYFVILAGPAVKIAARWKGSQLSIRAEGTGLEACAGALGDLGLSVHTGGHYSAHFHVDGQELAAKTIGAVIGAVASVAQVDTPIPNAFVFQGKGS